MIKKIESQALFTSSIAEGVSLVDFYASWCGPCKMLSPLLEELSEEMKEELNFFKVDVDEVETVAVSFGIEVVPTVILFKEGREIARFSGFREKEGVISFIKSNLSK